MKNLIKNITAKKQVMLITGAVMLTVIIITVAASFSIYSRAAERDADSRMALQMDYAVRNLDNQLNEYTSSIMSLYLNTSFQELLENDLESVSYSRSRELISRIRNIVSSEISRYAYVPDVFLYIRSGDGYTVLDRNGQRLNSEDFESEEWFRDICENNRRIIRWSLYEFGEDEDSGLWLNCAFLLKRDPDGETAAVVRIVQRLKYVLANVCSSFDMERGGFCVLDGENGVIYAEGAEKDAMPAIAESAFSGGSCGDSGSVKISGGTAYWKRCEKLGWTLVYFAGNGSIVRYSQSLPVYLVVTVTVIAVAVCLLLFSSKMLTDRLVRLSNEVGRVSRDRLTLEGDISGEDEVGRLAESFRSILDMARELIEEKGRVEKERYAIELQALQERINPHFLYNTLSTVSAMAQQIEAYDISDALYNLADFYRLSLSHGSSLITLSDELKILSVYLDICRIRFGSNIRIEVDVDESCGNYLVPKLIIQPFIENSIMHGIDITESEDNEIHVEIRREGDELAIYITDNGGGMSEEQLRQAFGENQDGKLHAIKNIDRRIKLRYGDGYGVTIRSAPGEGTQVRLLLPAVSRGKSD